MKPKDRQSAMGLLPCMEARPRKNGLVTYRYHPARAKPINLGTDRDAAIRKVLDMNNRAGDEGTVAQLWRLYQDTVYWTRLAPNTQRSYTELSKPLLRVMAKVQASDIRPTDVARYLRVERANSQTIANREIALLSNLMNLAVERGQIDRNPCKEVRRNPEHPRTRLVEAAELAKFVQWALQQGKSAVVLVSMAEFAALSGNRRGEFLRLHWPQVDDELIRLTRIKQHGGKIKRELVSISDALRAVLERVKALPGHEPLGAVFRAPKTGNPYSERGFKAMWNRLMVKALQEGAIAERFTFHDLRAHYTTYFKLRFGDLPELHSDAKTTSGVYERSREIRRQSL